MLFRSPGAWMDGEGWRLVDDQQVFILEHDRKGDIFRRHRGGRRRRHHNLNALSPPEVERWFGRTPIDGDMAGFDERLYAGPGVRGQMRGQESIEPDVLVGGVNIIDVMLSHEDNCGTGDWGLGAGNDNVRSVAVTSPQSPIPSPAGSFQWASCCIAGVSDGAGSG